MNLRCIQFITVLVGILGGIPVWGTAQNASKIDSMKNLLSVYGEDTNKVKTLNELAWAFRPYDPDSCQSYAERALAIALEIDFPREAATSWTRIGDAHRRKHAFQEAINCYQSAFAIDSQAHHIYGMGRAYLQIALVYKSQSEFADAIDAANTGVSYASAHPQTMNTQKLLGQLYSTIGSVYRRQGYFQHAVSAYDEALRIRQTFPEKEDYAKTLLTRGLLFESLDMYDAALDSYKRALFIFEVGENEKEIATTYNNMGNAYFGLGEYDSSLAYHQRSLKMKWALKDTAGAATSIHNMGLVKQTQNDHAAARAQLNQALSFREKGKSSLRLAETHLALGASLIELKRYKEAKVHLDEALVLAQQAEVVPIQLDFWNQQAKLQRAMGQDQQAFESLLFAASLRDSLTNVERKALSYEKRLTDARVEKDQLERELGFERKQSALQSKLTYAITGGSILLLLAAFFSMSSLRQRQRATIAEQQALLGRNEIDDLLKNQEIKIMSAMVEGQDEASKRIAADLHDRLGGILSMVRLHFSAVEKNIHQMEARNQEQYAIATDLLNQACDTVRAISHDIGDNMLITLGLVPAIQDMASTIEASRELKVAVIHHGMEERLPNQVEVQLFKVVQELMSNILKHAQATHVSINLLRSGDRLSIVVEDDGVGFDPEDPENREGMGMVSMRARVKEMEGEIAVDSQRGHGTTTSLEIVCPTIENSLS